MITVVINHIMCVEIKAMMIFEINKVTFETNVITFMRNTGRDFYISQEI